MRNLNRIGTTTNNTQSRMSKIIFLDIDGPIAHGTWMDGPMTLESFSNTGKHIEIPYGWVKEDCLALAEILEKTDAYVVVSSDWRRFYTLAQLRVIFSHHGVPTYRIIDVTSQYNPGRKMSSSIEWERAQDISNWVKTFKPKHWIVIDDLPLGSAFKSFKISKWRLVQADGDFGTGNRLRDKVEECVEKLSR